MTEESYEFQNFLNLEESHEMTNDEEEEQQKEPDLLGEVSMTDVTATWSLVCVTHNSFDCWFKQCLNDGIIDIGQIVCNKDYFVYLTTCLPHELISTVLHCCTMKW